VESNIQSDILENRQHVILLLCGDNEVSSKDFTNTRRVRSEVGGSSSHIEVFIIAYTILIEDIKGNRQLRISSCRRHDRIKPGIKSILRSMLTMRLPN